MNEDIFERGCRCTLLAIFVPIVIVLGIALILSTYEVVSAEERELTVAGAVTSIETRIEPTMLWFGEREKTYVYLMFDDGHAAEVKSDSEEYKAIAGCKVGYKAEIDKTERLNTTGIFWSCGEVVGTRYGDVRLIQKWDNSSSDNKAGR